ncbi:hypothetical protein [Flavobacterium sp.]|uniref:hypothetical protein n=1 Tax=Flavobacterium sp. TaxID=239 RepID=UPI003D12F221
MRFILITILVLFTTVVFGQDGKRLPSLKIPRMEIPELEKKKTPDQTVAPEYSLKNPFEPKLFKVPPKKYDPPQEDTKMQMSGGGSDLNVGKQYAEKMNKSMRPQIKEGVLDPKVFRQHQYFGDFDTESETVTLTYRDFGEIDGDKIRILINGQQVSDQIFLEGSTKKIILGLTVGINHIEIEALNEGIYAPNTGEFRFFDDKEHLITGDQWGLATGFKAKFNIVRIPKGTIGQNTTEGK